MRYLIAFCVIFSTSVLHELEATHIRAGNMTAEFVSGYTWRFYLTVYTNIEAINSSNNQLDLLYADIYVNGVKIDSVRRASRSVVGDFAETYKNDFVFNYTFAGPKVYVVSFIEENRNNGIRNIAGGMSDPYPFYIETYVLVSPLSANANNTPVLYVPPLDKASVDEVFIHNAGAFDFDGDSLSYKLVVPKQSATLDVPQYQFMDGLSLDPVTGDLVWDSPREEGLYNIAFLIEEWRNGIRIGYVLRDMQIAVEKTENKPPVLQIPDDTCVIATAELKGFVSATDPDRDRINLRTYSGVYELGASSAVFTLQTPNPQISPAEGMFSWQTNCALIRKAPYQIVFKAEDLPPNKKQLFDLKTWNVRLLAPSIDNLSAKGGTKAVQLSWKQYACSSSGDGVIEIYRKQCDSIDFSIAQCDRMNPQSYGFIKIAQVRLDHTAYTDDDQGRGLAQGNYYCYVLKVQITGNKGGESAFSEQVCASPDDQAPVPIRISVTKSDSLNGKISLGWIPPINLDTTVYAPPYSYRISRGEDINSNYLTEIARLHRLNDTTYVDSTVNSHKSWIYSIALYSRENKVAESAKVSTIDFNVIPGSGSAGISWQQNTPWKQNGFAYTLYKKRIGDSEYTLLAKQDENSYTDLHLDRKDTLCYYVEATGEYCLDTLKNILISNRSAEKCIVPVDSSAPCPPQLFIEPLDCIPVDQGYNALSWIPNLEEPCNPDIAYYNLYFSPRIEQETSRMLSLNELSFTHYDSVSLAGCYEVTAVSPYHIESERSNKVCTDICVYYALPNLFTPNGDGANDLFRPLRETLNASSVLFTVYNRWGGELYRYEGDPYIFWDGRNGSGEQLNDGVYFYSARVTFRRRLNPDDDTIDLKGWIQLISRFSGSQE